MTNPENRRPLGAAYDVMGTCPYCGGSQYDNEEGGLKCEDCGEVEGMGPQGTGQGTGTASTGEDLGFDWEEYRKKIGLGGPA